MKEITRIMCRDFGTKKNKFDWMGYEFKNVNELSFHHLIIPKRECKLLGIPNEGYLYWNGAILVQNTAHNYLHIIQNWDLDRFEAITQELICINNQRKVMYNNLVYIDDILMGFEREYSGRTKNKKPIVKEEYTRRLVRYDSRRIR